MPALTLLGDIGNSRWKLALYDHDLRFFSAFPIENNNVSACEKPLRQWKDSLTIDINDIGAIWLASVRAPHANAVIKHMVHKIFNAAPQFAQVEFSRCEIQSDYDQSELGVDRFLALLAARARLTTAGIIVDCGSATTIDWLEAAGRHRGGLILPGPAAMRKSLHHSTDLLPQISHNPVRAHSILLGQDTQNAILRGCAIGFQQAIRGAVNQLKRLDPSASVIVTGGNAQHCKEPDWLHREHLVLEGLAIYTQRRLP